MKMGKFRNLFLFLLIVLSQIHTLFRGVDFDFVWLLNGVKKSPSFTLFLFSKYITVFYVLYISCYSKKVNRHFLKFLLVLSFYDIIHFLLMSGFGFQFEKIIISIITYYILERRAWQG